MTERSEHMTDSRVKALNAARRLEKQLQSPASLMGGETTILNISDVALVARALLVLSEGEKEGDVPSPSPAVRDALEKAARQFDFVAQKILPANRLLAVGCFEAAKDLRAALSPQGGEGES
jgi:hypothetical protein